MSDGKEPDKVQIRNALPGYAEGSLLLPGSQDQEGQAHQGQEQGEEEIVTPAGLFAACQEVCEIMLPKVEYEPAVFLAFQNMIQLINFINAHVAWEVV